MRINTQMVGLSQSAHQVYAFTPSSAFVRVIKVWCDPHEYLSGARINLPIKRQIIDGFHQYTEIIIPICGVWMAFTLLGFKWVMRRYHDERLVLLFHLKVCLFCLLLRRKKIVPGLSLKIWKCILIQCICDRRTLSHCECLFSVQRQEGMWLVQSELSPAITRTNIGADGTAPTGPWSQHHRWDCTKSHVDIVAV